MQRRHSHQQPAASGSPARSFGRADAKTAAGTHDELGRRLSADGAASARARRRTGRVLAPVVGVAAKAVDEQQRGPGLACSLVPARSRRHVSPGAPELRQKRARDGAMNGSAQCQGSAPAVALARLCMPPPAPAPSLPASVEGVGSLSSDARAPRCRRAGDPPSGAGRGFRSALRRLCPEARAKKPSPRRQLLAPAAGSSGLGLGRSSLWLTPRRPARARVKSEGRRERRRAASGGRWKPEQSNARRHRRQRLQTPIRSPLQKAAGSHVRAAPPVGNEVRSGARPHGLP